MTTLIKNILLVDGSGQPAVKADVLIKNEKIAAIGSFPRYQADTIIDGIGAYLAPGFIDINTSSDRYLTIFSNPGQRHFLEQGITTIIGGQDGISLAPLLYGSLDLQAFWTDPYRINIDWHTVKEFFDVLRRKTMGVNFGTLVGHSTVRHTIIGNDFRDLTAKELGVFQYMLEQALQDGAFGISFDLQSPVAALTPAKEIRSLLEIVEKHKGLAAFKIRNGSDTSVQGDEVREQFVPAVAEVINLSRETGARVQLNNFAPLKGLESEYREEIEAIEEAAATADTYFTVRPFERSVIPIVSFLPVRARRGSMQEILQGLASKEIAVNIIPELAHISGADAIIYDAPEFAYLCGKTLQEFANDRELAVPDALLELMRMTKLRATLVYPNLSMNEFGRALASDRSLVASGGASFAEGNGAARSPRLYLDAVPTLLKRVHEEKEISIETAVRKLTSIPAQRLGLKNRGFIREGYIADLVLFRDATIETVFVNGAQAVRDGVATGQMNGTVLIHGHD